MRLYRHHARARQAFDVIGGSQQPRMAGEVLVDLALVPHVIAGGEHVQPEVKHFFSQLRSDAEPSGRVLDVRDGEMNFLRRHDVFQMPPHYGTARRSEYIADK